MIKIPEQPKIEVNLIDRMARGYQIAKVLNTAVDMDIFTRLERSKTAEEISKETESNPLLMRKFLNVLVSLQLLSKKDDTYTKTQLSEIFLTKDNPFYQGNLINLELKDYEVWSKLDQALKDKVNLRLPQLENTFDKRFILAMAEANMRGPLYKVTKAISDLAEFKSAKRLLDLGGGHGLHAIALVQENAQLEGVIFDLPPVVEVAKKVISQYQMEGRVKVIGGDYMKDDIGNGYDIIFVSHTFYKPKEQVFPLLKKIHAALNREGLAILNHWILSEDGTASEVVTLWDLWLSLLGYHPHIYTKDEAKIWLEEAGFSLQNIVDISTPPDPSILVIGRKEDK